MTDHNKHKPDLPPDAPDALRDLEASLDALGARTRDSAPDDLGERIVSAGAEILAGPRPGELRLTGAEADPAQGPSWMHHWRLAASITLLIIAVIAAIVLDQSQPTPGQIAEIAPAPAPSVIDDEWIEFETTFAADTAWDDDDLKSLVSELDELELSFNTAWTLDEDLNLNEGESL